MSTNLCDQIPVRLSSDSLLAFARRALPEADMFHNSSHKRFWIFKGEGEVEHLRSKANQKFRNKILEGGKVSITRASSEQTLSKASQFLFMLFSFFLIEIVWRE